MNIGFTGSRHGLPDPQYIALERHLVELKRSALPPFTAHHGGAVGADRIFHHLCRELWDDGIRITIHPASNLPPSLYDWSDADDLRDPKPALDRNTDIVTASLGGVLLACPQYSENDPRSLRSGTWATIRRGRKQRAGVVVVWADGTFTDDGRPQ